jgi:hypothetical protein
MKLWLKINKYLPKKEENKLSNLGELIKSLLSPTYPLFCESQKDKSKS